MQANAVKLHTAAIEMKAVVGRELKGADAERRLRRVHKLASHQDARDDGVEARRLDVPELGLAEGDRCHAGLRAVGGDGETRPQLGDLLALWIEQIGRA